MLLNSSKKALSSQSIVDVIENLNWPRPRHFTRIRICPLLRPRIFEIRFYKVRRKI